MTRLRCRAPGKVNLVLFIGRARSDGFHPLVSLVQPLSLADELMMEPAGADEVVCPGVEGENLAASALAAYRFAARWISGPVRITIEKRVPVAAGMGGGSADAAAVLRLVSVAHGREYDLALGGDADQRALLGELAAGLGADVDALVDGQRCVMTGIGRRAADLPDPDPFGVLVVPSQHRLSTQAVYREFDRLGLGRDADELDRLSGAVRGAAHDQTLLAERLLHNDLEAAARSLCPPIGEALADVRAAGAVRAMISGSGPTVVGLFPGADGVSHAEAAAVALRPRHPGAIAAAPVGRGFGRPREA
jgi:4-diphosphocytidyl-2-C-methyl-D-erythritol kinase